MTELDAYIQFRKEIDTMFYPKYRKMCDVSTKTDEQGNVIALLIVENDYIDCLWVDEKHRGNGIGFELVVEHILNYGMPKTLRILQNNHKAYKFWNKVFVLKELESNPYDCLYSICSLKSRCKDDER